MSQLCLCHNSYVSRLLALVLVAGLGLAEAQLRERQETPPEAEAPLIDEDEDLLPRTQYAFNPIQAKKDLKIGNFYARRGNHRAAAGRYLEATKWNPSYAEAYWRLGRSREKLKQPSDALAAYRRISPTGAGRQKGQSGGGENPRARAPGGDRTTSPARAVESWHPSRTSRKTAGLRNPKKPPKRG